MIPEFLIEKLKKQYGEEITNEILEGYKTKRKVTFRVNTLKSNREEIEEILKENKIIYKKAPFYEEAYIIEGEREEIIRNLDIYKEGKIYLQSLSSMLPPIILNPKENMDILDMTAAPGGKTFYIAENMQNKGELISCDIYEHKLEKIKEGAKRLGFSCITTRLADSGVYQPQFEKWADAVLCDVPCSGLGIIRKKPEIRFKTDEELSQLPKIQVNILRNCANYVKVGGTIIYSTCTILQRENQDVVNAFLSENRNFELEAFDHPICGKTDGMITLLPHIHMTDGFFIAKLRRKS